MAFSPHSFVTIAVNPVVASIPGQIETLHPDEDPASSMNIILIKGDSKKVPVELSLDNYEPLNLTGATVRFTVKGSPTEAQAAAFIKKTNGSGITVVDAATGKITIDFAPVDTESLEEMIPLTFDIEVTTAGNDRYTLKRGVFTLSTGITN